jgi:hypothetical protein
MVRIGIAAERKRVVALEPPEVALAAVLGLSQCEHGLILDEKLHRRSEALAYRSAMRVTALLSAPGGKIQHGG